MSKSQETRPEYSADEPRAELRAPIDGPFEAWFKPKNGRRGVMDDHNGITLTVHGFVDDNEYRKYCKSLAATLNARTSPPPADQLAQELREWYDAEWINDNKLSQHKAALLMAAVRRLAGSAQPPSPEYFDFDRAKTLADAIVQKVCDSPEHTSPDDDPQLLLCYAGELENHVISALEIEFERRTGRSCCERPTATKCEGRE